MDEDWKLAYARTLYRQALAVEAETRAAIRADRVEAFALKMILRGQFPSKGWRVGVFDHPDGSQTMVALPPAFVP